MSAERVTIHISPEQRRVLIAGLPVGTAVFALDRAGSFTLPRLLPHVTFVPVLTPAALSPDPASHDAAILP